MRAQLACLLQHAAQTLSSAEHQLFGMAQQVHGSGLLDKTGSSNDVRIAFTAMGTCSNSRALVQTAASPP